jgi:Ca2+-transporting ATPase
MAYYEADVNVLRDGKVIGISSMYVVPGDIVLLEEGSTIKMPFDGVLLEGEVLINESALTG